jgi:hypothetical protein
MNKYLKAINESLELSHKQNENHTQLLNMAEENIILQIEKLKLELQSIQKLKQDQERRDERYHNITNISEQNNNTDVNIANVRDNARVEQPMKINTVEKLIFGNAKD